MPRPGKPPRSSRPQNRNVPPNRSRGKSGGPADQVQIFGLHAVREALANPRRRSLELFCTENARNRLDVAVDAELKQTTLTSRELDGKVGPDAVHQGVILNARPLPAPDFDPTGHEIWVVLDQVTDPHNVGAIIRSAVAIGATAILTTQRNAPSESGTLLKSASGAFEHIAYIQLSNLADGLRTLGKAGVFRIGLDSDGPAPLETALENRFSGAPVAIVLGAEGKGLRTLTREHCDQLARLDLPGPIHSLNVSNAAALALYLTHKARP